MPEAITVALLGLGKRALEETCVRTETIGWSFILFKNAYCFICSLFGTTVGLKICLGTPQLLEMSPGGLTKKKDVISLELESVFYELEIVVIGRKFP